MAILVTSIDTLEQPATRPGSIPDRAVTARTGWWLVAGAAVALAALATWNSAHKSLWVDEGYAEYTSRLSVVGSALRALHYELQAPLYFTLLDIWRHIDRSVMFGRALSTLAVAAFVFVMAAIGRRAGLKQWWWLGVAAASMPGAVWAASELRCFALMILLSALSLYFYLRILSLRATVARWDAVGYVVTAVVGLYTFYYIGFVLAGQWIAALVARRRVLALTALLAIVGCTLLPMVHTILWQIAVHPVDTVYYDIAAQPRYALFKTIGLIVGEFEARPDVLTLRHALPIVLVILLAVPIVRTVASSEPWDRFELALTAAVAAPLMVLWLLRLFNVVPVHPPHFLSLMPGLLLIYGIWLQRIAAGWPRRAVGCAMAAVTVTCLVSFEQHDVQFEDWRGAAHYVASHAGPNDMVLMYDPDRMLPFNDYFDAISRGIPVHGVPIDVYMQRYDPYRYTIQDTAAVAARIQALGANARPVWFLSATRLLGPLKEGPSEILQYLSVHDRLDAPVLLTGVQIVHAEPR
jgi:mannosyltransferase